MKLLKSNLLFIAMLALIVVGPSALAAWLGSQAGPPSEQMTGQPSTTMAPQVAAAVQAETVASPEVSAVFNANACGGCHVIPGIPDANGQVGPDLSNLGAEAPTRGSGYTAQSYIHESIVNPNAFIALKCPAGDCPSYVMPGNYAQRLSVEDLDKMVNYLSTLGSGG